MIRKEYRDDKAVKTAVNGLYNKDFVIVGLTDDEVDEENAATADEAETEE